ncbi:ribonuclease H-like domain-containing protein [Tanacetum coccineum]
MAFVSSPIITNEVNTAYGVSTDNTQVSPASTQVSTTSTQVSTANLNDLEERDLKWQLALLSMRTRRFFQKTGRKITINRSDTAGYDKSKVKCFNCHKLGHFARECRGSRNQDSRNRNQDSSIRTVNVEETSSKAILAIDGAGFNWSYMADDEVPTNMALMIFSDSELEKLKQEKESNQLKIENFDNASKRLFSPPKLNLSNSGLEEFQQPEFEGYGPKTSKCVSEDISNKVRETLDAPFIKELVSDDKLEKKTIFPTVAKIEFVRPKQQEKPVKKPVKYSETYRSQSPRGNQRNWNNQKSQQLGSDFVMYNKAYFVCGSFDHVQADCNYHQRERVVSGNNYTRVLLNVPKKNNMYSVDMKNIIPKECLTCLVAKTTLDESMLWHRRLGKFDGKSDKGFFVGYSMNSKAFRVYNIRTRKVEENLHIRFLEDKPIIAGDGPKWLFDIDVLTKSINYVPVVAGTNSKDLVGTEEIIGACHSSKEIGSIQDYILMPLWKNGSLFDSSSKNASNDEPQPSSDVGKKDDEGVNIESRFDD